MAKPRRKKKTLNADLGTPELQAKPGYEYGETRIAGVGRTTNTMADQLQTYFRRSRISRRQYQAGDLFQQSFYAAGIGPNYTTQDLLKVRVDAGGSDYDGRHIHRESLYQAMKYVGQPLSRVLVHVCGHGHSAGSWPGVGDTARPDKEGMVALRLALNALADHYHLT